MLRRTAILGLVVLALTAAGAAATPHDYDVTANLSETDLDMGQTVTMSVSLDGFNESDYSYRFNFGGQTINTTETTVEAEVGDDEPISVQVMNGSTVVAEDQPSYRLEVPDDYVQIDIPDEIEPGDTFEATATIDGEVREDYRYEWRESRVTGEDFSTELEETGPTVTLEAREDGRAPDSASIQVHVMEDDEDRVGEAEAQINWELYSPDVEGLDASYDNGSVTISVTEQRLEEYPEVRMGSALRGWSRVRLSGRRSAGGVELMLEQVEAEEIDAPEDIVIYSVVDVSGENLDGLELQPTANIERDWLEEHGLLVSSSHAHISYYRIEDGDWERLPSRPGYSSLDSAIGLDPEYDHDRETQNPYILSGETRIAIAGDTSGIDFGRFVIGPEDQCEEFDEDEPIPPGWEEIEINCEVHEDAQQFQERLDHFTGEEAGLEFPEAFEDNVTALRSLIDQYRIQEAKQRFDQLRQQIEQYQERQQEVEMLERRFERYVEEMERIPEQFRDDYERPEDVKELIDEYENQIEQRNITAAERTLEQIIERERGARQRVMRMAELQNEIERIRERDLSQDQQEQVDQAEQLLDQGNITAAEQRLGSVQEDFQRSELRQVIASVVRDVLTDLLGLDLGGDSQSQQQAQQDQGQQLQTNRSTDSQAGSRTGPADGSRQPGAAPP